MSDDEELLQFLEEVDWKKYIHDDVVKNHLNEAKDRIQQLKDEDTSEAKTDEQLNISGATRIKLVVVGDGAVGKTSLLISYATKKFPTDYVPTVFENYTAQMKKDTETILLHLWDTAGQEDYDRLRPLSYPGADVVLLCFSTVNKGSYDAIREKWYPEVHHYVPKIPHILVGTKVDLRDSHTADPHTTQYEPISKEEGDAMAKQISAAKYVEVSAKTRKGLAKVFETAVDCVLEDRGVVKAAAEGGDGNHASTHTVAKVKPAKRCVMM